MSLLYRVTLHKETRLNTLLRIAMDFTCLSETDSNFWQITRSILECLSGKHHASLLEACRSISQTMMPRSTRPRHQSRHQLHHQPRPLGQAALILLHPQEARHPIRLDDTIGARHASIPIHPRIIADFLRCGSAFAVAARHGKPMSLIVLIIAIPLFLRLHHDARGVMAAVIVVIATVILVMTPASHHQRDPGRGGGSAIRYRVSERVGA